MRRVLSAVCFVLACGDSEGSGGNGGLGGQGGGDTGGQATGAGTEGGAGPCANQNLSDEPDFDVPASILAFQRLPFTEFHGSLLDGDRSSFFVETDRSGACRLLAGDVGTCTPGCSPGDVCQDGACVPQATLIEGATATLTGVGDEPVTIDGTSGLFYWSVPETPDVASLIGLTVVGAAAGTFELETCVPEELVPIGDWGELLKNRAPGDPVTLTWEAPQPGARMSIRMTTCVGSHGGIAHAEIECEAPDTGSLTIDGAFLDELYSEGWDRGECGNNTLFRSFYSEETQGDLRLRFAGESRTQFSYHAGLN